MNASVVAMNRSAAKVIMRVEIITSSSVLNLVIEEGLCIIFASEEWRRLLERSYQDCL